MYYNGLRKTVPASRYGAALMVMEDMHWTWQEYNAQPWDLVVELQTRLVKRAAAQARRDHLREKQHGV